MPLGSDTRLNHYDIVALIGEGGMGVVYRATDTKLRRDVALKVLPVDVTADADRLERFEREARALAALHHPNIVTIYSVEESHGVHFLTMELVEGRTLDAVLAGGSMGLEELMSVAVPLADAVAAAHAAGLTHRDLKPQNVMVGRDGRLKVLDFGLARFGHVSPVGPEGVDGDGTTMFRTREQVVGTVPYMSPEQAQGGTIDARSDVFSLGVMFYQMATGRRPFVGKTSLALVAAILRDSPDPVAALAPALPASLHAIIERSLAKDPAARYRDGAALYRALRDVGLSASRPARSEEVDAAAADSGRPRPGGPQLVGRHAEYGKLTERLQDAAGGTGSLLLLGGEPGVGKTRLAEELLREARSQGMLAMTGHCVEAGTIPFSPFVEIIEQLLRETPAPALREALGEDAPDIARLVPRIRSVWDDLPEPTQLEPEQQRHALFHAVLDFLRRLGARRPVVLLFDDLHWGDEATIGLLRHLGAHLADLRVLCLGTYRDVEIDVGTPFEKAMATLVRQKRGVLLPVRRLPLTSVAKLLTALGGPEPPSPLVEAIFHETEGNPFFVGELFQHLSDVGQLFDPAGRWKTDLAIDSLDVPDGVRLVIGRRLTRLSEATQALLTTAAVVGRRFELRLVEALGSLDSEAFLEAIEEAEAAKLVASERAGRQTVYSFTHELIRSTLLSALSLPRSQRLHARVAKMMETVYGATLTGHAAAMAHHLFEAGPASDEAQTIRFLILASDQAIGTGGLESGLLDLTRALSLVPADDLGARATLLWKHGLARRNLGQLAGAIEDWETALRLFEGGTDRGAIVSVCQDLAHAYAWTGQPTLGASAARRGLAALGPQASSDRCRLLGSVGWNLALACDFESADPILRDALAMAETLGDVQLLGELLLFNSWHYYLCMRRREQAEACRRAAELLRPTRDLGKLGEALVNFEMASIQIGRPGDIARTEEETRTLADRLGRFDIKVHRWYSEAMRDWLIAGNLDGLDVALRHVEGVAGAWRWIAEANQAQSLLWRGRLDAATDRARAALAHEPPGTTHTGFGWGMLFLCECTAARREPALSLLEEHEGHLPRAGTLNTIGSWSALFKVIEGLAALGEAERAAAFQALVVEALATETVVVFDASHLLETVAGMAATGGGNWHVAETHYRTALRLAGDMPFISERAEARYWYARMLVDRDAPGDRGQARGLLETALPLYQEIRMPWHARRAEALVSETRIR